MLNQSLVSLNSSMTQSQREKVLQKKNNIGIQRHKNSNVIQIAIKLDSNTNTIKKQEILSPIMIPLETLDIKNVLK